MLKHGDRVKVIQPKKTWNGKRTLVRVGAIGSVIDDESTKNIRTNIRILIDGQKKGCWIYPDMLEKI